MKKRIIIRNRIYLNSVYALIVRLLTLFVVFGFSRLIFYLCNLPDIGALRGGDWWGVLRGSFFYDSVSIFYLNIPFILLSLFPYRNRVGLGWQKMLSWVYILPNGAGLAVSLADAYFYRFNQARLTGGDFLYRGEESIGSLWGHFLSDYWWGILLWLVLCILLYRFSFKFIRVERRYRLTYNMASYYLSQTVILLFCTAFTVFAIRGYTLSAKRAPLSLGDAVHYVRPQLVPLIQGNPYCLIQTVGKDPDYLKYMPDDEADRLVPLRRTAPADSLRRPNIVLLVVENLSNAHIKALSDEFPPDRESATPFLDSLLQEGYLFENAYNSGYKNADLLPALWASIPAFRDNLLRFGLPDSAFRAFPEILRENGYATLFLHGAPRQKTFETFARQFGVAQYIAAEDYERQHGTGDTGGQGVWDHRFLPFAEKTLSRCKQPFFATILTTTSAYPYTLPRAEKNRFTDRPELHRALHYADRALADFFRQASREPWFANTLFIVTGDHGSRGGSAKYRQVPYRNRVPLLFYAPDGSLKGRSGIPAQHIDLMPTLVPYLGCDSLFTALGNDLFAPERTHTPVVRHEGSLFHAVGDSIVYFFDGHEIVSAYDYRNDYLRKREIPGDHKKEERLIKAYLQQYYQALEKKNFRPDPHR